MGKNGMGDMAEMMSKMMGEGGPMGGRLGMPMMEMMGKMMPKGLSMMMDRIPKDQRVEFAKEMIAVMAEKGSEGLSEKEREAFFDDLVLELRPEKKSE